VRDINQPAMLRARDSAVPCWSVALGLRLGHRCLHPRCPASQVERGAPTAPHGLGLRQRVPHEGCTTRSNLGEGGRVCVLGGGGRHKAFSRNMEKHTHSTCTRRHAETQRRA
jgi:hypothetical protein